MSESNENKKFKISILKVFVKSVRIAIGLAVIAVQVFIIVWLSRSTSTNEIVGVLFTILSVLVVLVVCRRQEYAAYKIIWLIAIFLFPFAGSLFYVLYGHGNTLPKKNYNRIKEYLQDKLPQTDVLDELGGMDRRLAELIYKATDYPIYKNNATRYYNDGGVLFEDLIKDLKAAEKYVFIESFIISEGELLDKLVSVLFERADNGVEVKIVFDTFGCTGKFKKSYHKMVSHKNITVVPFNPPRHWVALSLNYRDHRKLVVIDGKISYIGGVNIADEYVHLKNRFGFWRDAGMRICGDSVKSMVTLFCENRMLATNKIMPPENYFADSYPSESNGYVMPFGDSPNNRADPAYNLFLSLIDCAQQYIYISTPYLIIDDVFTDALCRASKSGVQVKIATPGIPDKKLVYVTTRSSYSKLMKAGVEIFEIKNTFNHAKMIFIDGKYAVCGSVNIDFRSMMLHWENAYFLINDINNRVIEEDFDRAFTAENIVDAQKWSKRNIFVKLGEFILAIFAPLM
ncbi:MAG: cardiolipin synthase [Clostridia bacterium]|nr:cardiolipin synthase [Clostridia bacterium]